MTIDLDEDDGVTGTSGITGATTGAGLYIDARLCAAAERRAEMDGARLAVFAADAAQHAVQ
jgi:hypothetical protein